MSRNNDTGCGIWGLIPAALVIIFILYQSFIVSPREDEAKRKRLNEFWTAETVDYFENYNCSNLSTTGSYITLRKFIVVESSYNDDCKIKGVKSKDFEDDSNLKNFYTRKINEANVIVWIRIVEGKEDGRYSNGTRAINNQVELKFIDKNSNSIFKTIILDTKGSAPDQIRRKRSNSRPEYFGHVSIDEIKETIRNEIL